MLNIKIIVIQCLQVGREMSYWSFLYSIAVRTLQLQMQLFNHLKDKLCNYLTLSSLITHSHIIQKLFVWILSTYLYRFKNNYFIAKNRGFDLKKKFVLIWVYLNGVHNLSVLKIQYNMVIECNILKNSKNQDLNKIYP